MAENPIDKFEFAPNELRYVRLTWTLTIRDTDSHDIIIPGTIKQMALGIKNTLTDNNGAGVDVTVQFVDGYDHDIPFDTDLVLSSGDSASNDYFFKVNPVIKFTASATPANGEVRIVIIAEVL